MIASPMSLGSVLSEPQACVLRECVTLTMRMSMRRFTRLTNALSMKIENRAYAVSLHYMFYNFCLIHKTLRVTPAMAAKVTDGLWSVQDIVDVIDDWEAVQQAA
jgi:hypothetical protein